MRRICTPAKVHNIYNTVPVLLSFFPLLIIIIMCQLSKCLFCVRIQRTDEVCDDKSQDKNNNRDCAKYATEADGAIIRSHLRRGGCSIYLQCCILYRLINTDGCNLQMLSSKSVCIFVFCFRMKQWKYLVTCLIVFDVFLCCFKLINKYLGIHMVLPDWCMYLHYFVKF